MSANKISLVIATMNRIGSLETTFSHIKLSSYIPDEIIVVDQSNHEVANKVKDFVVGLDLNNVKYVHQSPSLTKARNTGYMMANNDVLVFMDDDVNIEEDTFLSVYNRMKDPTVSMIAGRDLNAGSEKSILGYLFGKKSIFKKGTGYITAAMFGRLPKEVSIETSTEWAMGFFFVVRKSLVYKWNLKWDERFITYGFPEDMDFSYGYYLQSNKEGYKCIISPKIAVYHMVSKEWRETSKSVTYMFVINREYLTYKFNKGIMVRLATRWANFGIFLERLKNRDNPFDVLVAQYYCDRYRKDIKNGNLHTELYKK